MRLRLELLHLSILIVRLVAVLAVSLVIGTVWQLATRPLAASAAGLMRAELLLIGGVLFLAVLFFERVALRLIRTRGGKLRGPNTE
jgi:predicted permease